MGCKFSLLSATFNNEKYLKSWAKSILYQDYRPLEVVIVNDLSEDNTIIVLDEYRKKFEDNGIEVKIINNVERKFYASSLKIAMQNATGEYFGILDTDDMLGKGACSLISKIYEENINIAWIYTQFDIYNEKMKFKKKGFSSLPKNESLLDLGKKRKHGASHWRTFSNRVPNKSLLFSDGQKKSVDKFMWYVLEEMCQGMFVNKVCYLYRQGVPNCISKSGGCIEEWQKVIKEAEDRREKHKLSPIPIVEYKGR